MSNPYGCVDQYSPMTTGTAVDAVIVGDVRFVTAVDVLIVEGVRLSQQGQRGSRECCVLEARRMFATRPQWIPNTACTAIGGLAVGTKGPHAVGQGISRTEYVRMEHRVSCGPQ